MRTGGTSRPGTRAVVEVLDQDGEQQEPPEPRVRASSEIAVHRDDRVDERSLRGLTMGGEPGVSRAPQIVPSAWWCAENRCTAPSSEAMLAASIC